jgi:hypothetical protein
MFGGGYGPSLRTRYIKPDIFHTQKVNDAVNGMKLDQMTASSFRTQSSLLSTNHLHRLNLRQGSMLFASSPTQASLSQVNTSQDRLLANLIMIDSDFFERDFEAGERRTPSIEATPQDRARWHIFASCAIEQMLYRLSILSLESHPEVGSTLSTHSARRRGSVTANNNLSSQILCSATLAMRSNSNESYTVMDSSRLIRWRWLSQQASSWSRWIWNAS